ncbi:L-alanine exporter AlaE [Hasllibacter sp. MH4015]|uniref:L-alanine exporter AlaE n=1 Tax=Hasllibacter sp. MH4015 TaxID=2854029 RepID=UPI001CD4B356|nr:L-alanine exporter AlaE [Hasllibacter sp. MH4015]
MADTVALVSFFTVTGILNERFIVGMDWGEVATSRLIGAPLMVLTARPYGVWRDLVLGRFSNGTPLSDTIWDTLALLSFQVPIYVAIIFAGGAWGAELLAGAAGAAVIMLVLGRPYGLWLGQVRVWFGLPRSGGMTPMSPRA